MSYSRQFQVPDDGTECIICHGEIVEGSLYQTCSATCQDIHAQTAERRESDWDFDAEEALYA